MFLMVYRDARVAYRRIIGLEERTQTQAKEPTHQPTLETGTEQDHIIYINPRHQGLTASSPNQ